jgi:ABC-2 type transport system ATP-binding protein
MARCSRWANERQADRLASIKGVEIMNRIEKFRQDGSTSLAAPADVAPEGGGSPKAAEFGEPGIVLENLSKKYGSRYAVEDVSLTAGKGATIGLLGGNGAGKTTTIAMIMGLVIPTSGRALVLGHDMARERHKVLSRMNFESPYVALPARLTVRENLTVFGRLYAVPNLKARIADLVEQFDLGDVLDRPTGRLSAGQKTRVSMAKALINEPEVLLLDEPTASLDPDRAEWVRSRLQAYQRRRQATILLSSHNMLEVEQLCDFVAIMSYGHIVEMGSPQELMERYECSSMDEVFIYLSRGEEEWAEEE